MTTPEKDDITGTETTGHEWDGIKELNNPLPRWWLWCLYLCIIWAVGYSVMYPAWPMLNRATEGLIGYSTRANVAADIERVNVQNADVSKALANAELTSIETDSAVYHYAISGGAAVYRANCSQCHGSGAAGAKGYPNLLDDDWLWGGDIAAIEYTVRHGIRNTQDEDARYSEMPVFKDVLEKQEIASVANYVLSLSGLDHDAKVAVAGKALFADQCASCHGDSGEGVREEGGPALNDPIWLYGSDIDTVTTSIANARFGVMPAWGPRLSEADIKAVTLYIHQLGGGE